jgi:NAD-reducing hydrogenase small subunit
MSFLDMDERILNLIPKIDIVYSPLVDAKEFPEGVDVALVEGAVSSDEDLHKIKLIRERSTTLIALGDCAVTSNVPSMRNPFGVDLVMKRVYLENIDCQAGVPNERLPKLLPKARPLHEVVKVDLFVPGCPPSADLIYQVLSDLLDGKTPDLTQARFG